MLKELCMEKASCGTQLAFWCDLLHGSGICSCQFFTGFRVLIDDGCHGFLYSRCRVFLQADQSLYIVNFIDCIMYAIRIVVQIILVKNNASIVWIVVVPTIITPFKAIILKKL